MAQKFLSDLRLYSGGKLYTWTGHDDNYLKYDLWRASASAGMTIHNISADGEIYLKSGNATALTLDSSQNATFEGTLGIAGSSPVSTSALTIKSTSVSTQQSAIDIIQNGGTNSIIRMGEKSTDGGRFHMFDGGTEKIAFYTDGTDNHISAGQLGIGTSSPDSLVHLKTAEATLKFESTHGRHSLINQGGGNFHIKAVHSTGVGINYGDTNNPGLLKLYNNTDAKITLDASTGQISSGRLYAVAPGTGIHQLVNASTNSTVLQLITTGDTPNLALNFQSDHIYNSSSALHIQNNDQPLYLKGSQTTVGTTSAESGYELTVSDGPGSSIYAAGSSTFAGSVHLDSDSAQLQLGDDNDMQIYHNGANGEINNATGNFTIDSVGEITLDADGAVIRLKDGGTEFGKISQNSNNLRVYSSIQDGDMLFQGNDGGTTVTALTLDMSEGGNATFAGAISSGDITSTHTGGGTINLRRDDTTISGTNTLGAILFQGDDPTDGTFNSGAAIFGTANGSWASGSYPGQLELKTRNTSGSLVTALTLGSNQSATFAGNILMGNTVVNPASGFADQTGIALKYSATVPELQVSSDSTALQLGRTSTGGSGQIMAMRAASTTVHDFRTTYYSTTGWVDAANFKINGAQGSDGQVLTSTGSGVAWENASGGVSGSGADNYLALWNGTGAIDHDTDFYVDANTLYTTNLRITSDNGFYRETVNSNSGGESWNASNGWHRIIEITGGTGRGKCHFLIQTGGGSGTPCRVEGIVNTTWSNANSTLSILHNSYPNFITDIRVVRNSTSGKSFVDIKGTGEDYVTVTILPNGSTSAAIVNFTNVNTLPSGDSKQIEKTITNMIMSLATGTGANTSGETPFQVKYDGTLYGEQITLGDGSVTAPSLTNSDDTNTGVYFPGNHQLGFAVNGSRKMYMSETKTFFQNQANGVEINNKLTLLGVGGDGTPILDIQGTSSATFNWISKSMHANLTSGETNIHLFGQHASTKNSGYIGYTHSGTSGSDDNKITLGMYGANHLLTISPTVATFANKISSPHIKYCSASISNSYVRVYYAASNTSQLATAVRLTGTAHGNSHVANFTADILVNHYQDVVIESTSGGYTQVTLKVESNNNGDYTLSVKSASANAATYYFKVEAISDNVDLTTLPSSTASTSTTHEHTTVFGTNKTGEGGNIQHKVTGSLRVDDGNNYVEISEGSNSIGQIELHDSTSVFLQGWGSEFRVAVNGAYDQTALKIASNKNATLYGTLDVEGTGTSSIAGDLKMLSGTGGTTAKVIFQTTDNNDTSKFIRTNAYWNEYGAHKNEGHKFIDSDGTVLLQLNGGNSGTGNGALTATTAGNLHTHNVLIPSNKAVHLADRHTKLSFQLPYFTNGTSNLAVDLILGNAYINGVLDLKLTSGYSHQNAAGELHLKWIVGFNPDGSIWYTPHLVKSHVTSLQASQIYVDPPAWDSTNSRYFIRIYHKVNSGNVWEGTLENLSQNRATTLVSNFSVGSLLTSTSTTNTHPTGLYISDSSGDALLTLQSKTGGDPTIVMNSEAANRSGLIKYQDNGTNIGRIEYVHNGDKLQLQAGSATGYALQLENTKGIFSGNVGFAGTDPSYHIDINRATNDGWLARFKNTGTTPYGIHVDTSNSASTSYTFAAYTANANDFYIRNDGKVGVGAPSPTHTIHVKNNSGDVRGIMIEQAVTNSYAELAFKSDLREFRLGTGGDGTNNSRAENKFYIYDATTGGAGGHRFEIDSAGDVKILNGALKISGDDTHYVTLTETGSGLLTIATPDDLVLDADNDLILDAGGNDIRFKVDGVEFGKFKKDSNHFAIYSSIQDKDMIFRGNDGGTTIDALILDMSNGGSATFRDDVDINSGVLNLTKQNGSPTINMLYDGTNPGANTLLHYLNYKVDYSGTHQDWGGIEHRTTGSATRTKLNLNVKSTGGNVLNALSLDGTTDGTTTLVSGKLGVGSVNTSFDFYNNGTSYLNGTTTIDAACTINGQLTINPDADSQLILGNGGTNASVVFAGTGDDLYLGGNNTSSVRLYSGGAAEFYGALFVPEYIYHTGDTDTYIRFTDNAIGFRVEGADVLLCQRYPASGGNGNYRGAYAPAGLVADNLGGANLIRKGTDVAVSGVREEVTGPDGSRKVQAHASTGNGNNTNCYNWYSSENVRIDPEKDYEFSVWIKSTGDDHVYLGWHEYRADGTKISGNPYFHTSKIKTYANSNNSSTVAQPNINGWVLLKYQLKSHRTTSGQADTEGTDRYASHGNPKQHSGSTGVMHSTTTMVHLRLGSCYGSVNGSKTYFYNPKITEAQNDDIKHFLRAGQVDCMQTVAVQSGQRIKFDGVSGHTYIMEEGDNNLKFYVGASEHMGIGGGDVFIRKPMQVDSYIYHIGDTSTNINFESSQITIKTAGDSHIQINNDENIYFRTNGTNRFKMDTGGTFTATADIVAYGSVSDKSYKENIKPITGALELVDKLKGVTFDWKEDTDTNKMVGIKEDIGFIAQDVQEVLPTLVRENDNGKLSLRDKGIVPVLVEAIKELKQEIEQLKKQINNG